MRHLWSFLLALVLTPLIYTSAGFSAVKFGEAKELGLAAVLGLAAAFVAGGLYALLVMTRLSPVGPVFAGLSYLGVTLWAIIDRASFADTIPADLAGQRDLLHVPVGFGTALLAAPLLFTVFSPRRWRRTAQPTPPAAEAAPVYPPLPAPAPGASDLETTLPSTPTFGSPPLGSAPTAPLFGTPSNGSPTYEPPVYTPPSYTPLPPATEGERTGLM